MPAQQIYRQQDLSGGVQTATSPLMRAPNEVASSKNAAFNIKIGSAVRRPGYEQVGRTIQHGNDGLGAHVYRFGSNNKIIVGINNVGLTNATLRFLDTDNYWTSFITDAPLNTRFQMIDYLDEMYVAGKTPNNAYQTLTNVNSTLVPSTSRNVLNAPKCAYIAEYRGELYAINCEVNGVKYPNRAYKSSPATGAITYVRTDQIGKLLQLKVDSTRYLKSGMRIDIYGAGTEAKKVDSLTIVSVNKSENIITFASTVMNVSDNDEIWLEDRKNNLSILWNTDYPTPENSDFLQVQPGLDSDPAFTGWGKHQNRLFLFTKNSTLKWDGANLVTVSDSIGCVSHETVKTVGSWLVWLHTTGLWGYNGANGQLQLLSRGFSNYIDAINQTNLYKASAVVVGRVYKLAVGEIAELESATTSTSTSSTSTSSTSSSTSSTSTSSTSTSSTSVSTSSTSHSTSSTSHSTSSTSISSTSSSTSFSTSSTSTSTIASTKQCVVLVYDFDMNAFWPEYHTREMRFQFNHTMHGYTKPYFIDETGRLFRNETGDMDHNDTIPFEVEVGDRNFGHDLSKTFDAVVVDSNKARLVQVQASVDDNEWINLGQLDRASNSLTFPRGTAGRKVNYKFTHNDSGEAPSVNGITTYYSVEERRHGRTDLK